MIVEFALENIREYAISGGLGFSAGVFLCHKFLDHKLKKDMEIFKHNLYINQESAVTHKNEANKVMQEKLNELWGLCEALLQFFKKNNPDNINNAKLNSLVNSVDTYLFKYRVYIPEEVAKIINKITELSDPVDFKIENINELMDLNDNLVKAMRNILK